MTLYVDDLDGAHGATVEVRRILAELASSASGKSPNTLAPRCELVITGEVSANGDRGPVSMV